MSPRKFEGETLEFGTSGYTKNNVFVLYDRNTNSVWWPLEGGGFDAVAGEKRGKRIPFVAKPAPLPLATWVALHPNTVVLLPGPPGARERRRLESRLMGSWSVSYEWMGTQRTGEVIFERELGRRGLKGRWLDPSWECSLCDLKVGREEFSFGRGHRIGSTGPAFRFEGQWNRRTFSGHLIGMGQKLKVNGVRKK